MKNIYTTISGLLLVALLSAMSFKSIVVEAGNPESDKLQLVAADSEQPGPVTINAVGRGNPYINFLDSRPLPTAVLKSAIRNSQSEIPAALAAADFDEDGVPDLISAYTAGAAGVLYFYRGNVDAIYPNSAEAQQHKAAGRYTDSPFLPEALRFEAPVAPELIGTGDLDADGHQDLLFAARGGIALYKLSGDGRGGFRNAEMIALTGNITAMTTGELSRADGSPEVAVGIIGPDGPQLLVFGSLRGVLQDKSDVIKLREPATAISGTAGILPASLAVATGSELLLIHTPNPHYLDSLSRKGAKEQNNASHIERHEMGFPISAIAVGDFVGDRSQDLALLSPDGMLHFYGIASDRPLGKISSLESDQVATAPGSVLVAAKVSTHAKTDLIVLDQSNHQLQIVTLGAQASCLPRCETTNVEAGKMPAVPGVSASLVSDGEPVAVLPMRLNKDALSDLVVLTKNQTSPSLLMTAPMAIRVVTNTNDSGTDSLREKMDEANSSPGLDEIQFNIPGVGPRDFRPTSDLPIITESVTLDAMTMPGYAGEPLADIEPQINLAIGSNGLRLDAGNTVVRGVTSRGAGSNGNSVRITGATNPGGNIIEGCFLGTNPDGTAAGGTHAPAVNINGVPNNLIGGTTLHARNVVSGISNAPGVLITGASAMDNRVEGNYIGTDKTGLQKIPNAGGGVLITGGAKENSIGGSDAGTQNVISGNLLAGVRIVDSGVDNVVFGNLIGTDKTGSAALANNTAGVEVVNSSLNSIGYSTASQRNIVSGNAGYGVYVSGAGSVSNEISGNYVGTDITGTAALGNTATGIFLEDLAETSGTVLSGNVVSGNGGEGIDIVAPTSASTGNSPQGGFRLVDKGGLVGTNASGTAAIPNANNGIRVRASNVEIGGDTAADGNVISGNGANGILIDFSSAMPANSATPNGGFRAASKGGYCSIGTNAAGTAAIPNGQSGIKVVIPDGVEADIDLHNNLVSGNTLNGIEFVASTTPQNVSVTKR